jgi:hypothetical protein
MEFQKLQYCNFSKMSSFDTAVIFKQVFGVSNRGQFANPQYEISKNSST